METKMGLDKALEKQKHRIVRKRILDILNAENPNPVDETIIWYVLDDLGSTMEERELDAELAYLTERGYIVRDDRGTQGLKATLYHITASGIDLLTGILANGGVAW